VGVVKYLNQGADSVIDARRADAREKMRSYCAPDDYKVTDTGERSDLIFYRGSGGDLSYLYIRFECIPRQVN